ncbi:MAG: hypothetical protein U9N63_04225, partial [Pseudomonadota bacterium]|nr:hypothetical protein [Pseudomonadota bacterium]
NTNVSSVSVPKGLETGIYNIYTRPNSVTFRYVTAIAGWDAIQRDYLKSTTNGANIGFARL